MSEQRDKIAVLIDHWIEHNEGHRQSYLEWRDKLADEGLPETLAALERIADLTTEANAALQRAAAELGASGLRRARPRVTLTATTEPTTGRTPRATGRVTRALAPGDTAAPSAASPPSLPESPHRDRVALDRHPAHSPQIRSAGRRRSRRSASTPPVSGSGALSVAAPPPPGRRAPPAPPAPPVSGGRRQAGV